MRIFGVIPFITLQNKTTLKQPLKGENSFINDERKSQTSSSQRQNFVGAQMTSKDQDGTDDSTNISRFVYNLHHCLRQDKNNNNKNKQKTSESRTRLMTVLRRYDLLLLSWCFTSTESIRLIRAGEPRAATSTFTMLLYLHRKHKAY